MTLRGLRRRDFLKSLSIATAAMASTPIWHTARVAAAGRAKITEVKLIPLRVVKDLGSYPDWQGNPRHQFIGGGAFSEVRTDQGVMGIGPEFDPALLKQINTILMGQDPFDVEVLASRLYDVGGSGGGYRGSAGAEIAVWDLIGKLSNQPLYKLWGADRERVVPYASMLRLSTPEERGELAAKMKADGWKAMKVRSSFPTMREDIELVEAMRKTTGDDWTIMCDGNKATFDQGSTKGVRWDFTRACQTALEYQRLGVYWLEEPLPRYDYDQLAELKSHDYDEARWWRRKSRGSRVPRSSRKGLL